MNEGRTDNQSRVVDGAAYERMMGVWSRLTGEISLDWLAPRSRVAGSTWAAATGAFTELPVERCAPAEMRGLDPSEGQLAAVALLRRGVEPLAGAGLRKVARAPVANRRDHRK